VKDPLENFSPRASARRKLVRGAFAVPAMMTLRSGGALAATSVSCVANQVSSPATPPTVVTSNDGSWLRVQLRALVNPGGNIRTQDGYWIQGSDLNAFVVPGQTPFLNSTQFQRFDIVQNEFLGSATTTAPAHGGFTLQPVNKFVSLQVTSTGAIVGAGASTVSSPSSAVSGSCWNSFFLAA
jgi:hypothetical protein